MVTAYEFDTGRLLSQRQTIVQSIVVRLARLLRINGGHLHSILSFGGIVRSYGDEDGFDQLWSRVQGHTPSILVGLGDSQFQSAGGPGFRYNASNEVFLYFVNQHGAGLPRVYQDAVSIITEGNDPGVWYSMERAFELLAGFDVAGSDVKQLVPVRDEELATSPSFTLWRQTYSVQTARTLKAKRDVTTLLTGIDTVASDRDDGAQDPNPVSVSFTTELEP